MPLGVKHFTEPTTQAERAAIKAEQEQWHAMDDLLSEAHALLHKVACLISDRDGAHAQITDLMRRIRER